MLQLMLHHRNTQSFRPLSGSYISQYFISCVCLLFIFVSVPYRGATFLNCNNKKAWSWHAGERFPSPIGELHFSIVPCLQFSTDICFRPLSGSYISQYFLQICKEHGLQSFRPLSGSYISQYGNDKMCDFSTLVSVPYRGATFLNNTLKD